MVTHNVMVNSQLSFNVHSLYHIRRRQKYIFNAHLYTECQNEPSFTTIFSIFCPVRQKVSTAMAGVCFVLLTDTRPEAISEKWVDHLPTTRKTLCMWKPFASSFDDHLVTQRLRESTPSACLQIIMAWLRVNAITLRQLGKGSQTKAI